MFVFHEGRILPRSERQDLSGTFLSTWLIAKCVVTDLEVKQPLWAVPRKHARLIQNRSLPQRRLYCAGTVPPLCSVSVGRVRLANNRIGTTWRASRAAFKDSNSFGKGGGLGKRRNATFHFEVIGPVPRASRLQ